MSSDRSFSEVFSSNMEAMGLPVPNTLFKSIAAALGTTGALVGAIAKVGATATVGEIFLTASAAAGGTALAGAIGEMVAVAGAVAASFYVGACIGSLLVAAYEVLDVSDLISQIQPWLRRIKQMMGESAQEILKKSIAQFPQLAQVRKAVLLGIDLV